jgi:class 3 adenylate cyclase/tetratricopeptide (TPR) repeat protein
VAICATCGHEAVVEFKFCPECGATVAIAPAREQRKTVTVVFCDVVGSTALGESVDPEALRGLLARYYERMRGIVERHGGTVEKFIGDAVVAVFGVPVVHEDDALRACRAAVEMREALPELGVGCRIGINTGEVVTAADESLVTGDAVNVAARLEQAAQGGEVLIGAETLRLVRTAVEVAEARALDLKGKSEPVAAFPLVALTGELARRFASPMVGRARELRRLQDAFSQAAHDRSCQLFTVLGSAGVGKSRLAAEFLALVEATVFRGRCLSYGDGITYWPVVEVIKQAGALPEGEAARPLRSLLGETNEPASAVEIAWGFRKLLEQRAQERPVVCVLDDLHWAEETLLDLVEHVADLSRDAPLLLLCMARPELLDRRPSWGGGKWNATSVLLEPLDAEETEQLLVGLGGIGSELHARIVQVAEGNPLFLEEMHALVRDSAGGEVEVPPTIQALLAARLDQLEPAERSVLERGSVEGRIFHRGAVAALGEEDGQIDRQLLGLVRKELVRPDRPQLPQEDAYRFRHLLIRDAAYDALPKAVRANLHRRFAGWLETNGQELVELEEVLGYHLEQAARYLAELGRPDPAVAAQAAGKLAAAGMRARWRGDRDAARSLLGRALGLTGEPDLHLEVAHTMCGRNPGDQAQVLHEIAERADARADTAGAALARTLAAFSGVWAGEPGAGDEQERLALAAVPLLEAREDDVGLAEVWFSLANGVYNGRDQFEEMVRAAERAREHETRAGLPHRSDRMLAMGLVYGPCPVDDALGRLDALDSMVDIEEDRAVLVAMSDRIEEARTLLSAADQRAQELGSHPVDAWKGEIESLAGNHEAAAALFGSWQDFLAQYGQKAGVTTYMAHQAREFCLCGRYADAEPLIARPRDLDDENSFWLGASALVISHRGDHTQAEQLAREALAYSQKTDSLKLQADALADLAEVLAAAGRNVEAEAALDQALELYERKGIVPLARRTRERLATL